MLLVIEAFDVVEDDGLGFVTGYVDSPTIDPFNLHGLKEIFHRGLKSDLARLPRGDSLVSHVK